MRSDRPYCRGRSITLAIALAIAACSREDPKTRAPGPSSTAPKETKVLEVKSSADLVNLRMKYLERVEAGFSGVLEVHVAPGTYEPTNWDMAPSNPGAPPPIDLVLKGTGQTIPAPAHLVGRAVRIEGLVLTTMQFAPIQIETNQAVTITKSAFINGRMVDANNARPYLELRAHGAGWKKTPISVQIDNTWFVRNFETAKNSSLLAFTIDENEPGYFDNIAIRDCAFLGNAFSSEISISFAKAATIERTIFYKTWPAGVFLRSHMAGDVTVKDSVMVAEDIAQLAEVSDSPAIAVTGTKVYVKTLAASAAAPKGLKIDRAAITDRAPLGDTSAVDQAIAMPVAMPADTLRPTLDKVLHLGHP